MLEEKESGWGRGKRDKSVEKDRLCFESVYVSLRQTTKTRESFLNPKTPQKDVSILATLIEFHLLACFLFKKKIFFIPILNLINKFFIINNKKFFFCFFFLLEINLSQIRIPLPK